MRPHVARHRRRAGRADRRSRLRRRRRPGDPARTAQRVWADSPGRSSTTASSVDNGQHVFLALLRRVPVAFSSGSGRETTWCCPQRLDIPVVAPATGRRRRRSAGCAGRRCPLPCTSPGRSCATPTCRVRDRLRPGRALLAPCAACAWTTRPSTTSRFGAWLTCARAVRGGDRRRVGPDHGADGQPAGRGGVAGPGGDGVQDRAARRRARRPTSAGAEFRSAVLHGERAADRSGPGRRRCPAGRTASRSMRSDATRRVTPPTAIACRRGRRGRPPRRGGAGASGRRRRPPGSARRARAVGHRRRPSGLRPARHGLAADGRGLARQSSGCSTGPPRPASTSGQVPRRVDLRRGRPADGAAPRHWCAGIAAELWHAAAGVRRGSPGGLLRHQGTPRHVPGRTGHRRHCGPAAAHVVPGLGVAGAWTDTGWPATMEGAVRSRAGGRRATAARWHCARSPITKEVA